MQICLCLCVGDMGKIETAAALQFVVVLEMERRRPFINGMAVSIYTSTLSAGIAGGAGFWFVNCITGIYLGLSSTKI